MYLGTNGSRVDSAVVETSGHVTAGCGHPAMPMWRTETYNSGGGGGGCACKAWERRGRVEENGTERRDWVSRGCRSPTFRLSGLPQTSNTFVTNLRKKSRLNRPANRYWSALDGFHGPDNTILTVMEDLRIRLEDALKTKDPAVVEELSAGASWASPTEIPAGCGEGWHDQI